MSPPAPALDPGPTHDLRAAAPRPPFGAVGSLERAARGAAGPGTAVWEVRGRGVFLSIDGQDGLFVEVEFRAASAEVNLRGTDDVLRAALVALGARRAT